MLECIQVEKTYSGHAVLHVPSLQLENAVYWIQGSNGSGKTTFLRMIAGLLPFQGEIILDGISQRGDPLAYRRLVSWADAEPLYPSFLSGQDLVSFYREIRKAPDEQVARLTDLFQVRPYLKATIGTYSSGMIKKLSLLLSFIGSPAWIALDEPLVTLDREAIPILYSLIREYRLQRGTGFLISSHQDPEREALGEDRILVVRGGTVLPAQQIVPA
jgi:ABC-2 type transport system ATP-binding protein